MDPLSLTASVIAVAGLAVKVCSVIGEIRKGYAAVPGRLHAVNNEVEDLRLVLEQVKDLLQERHVLKQQGAIETKIGDILYDGQEKLLRLGALLGQIQQMRYKKRDFIFKGTQWKQQQKLLADLQSDIKRVKSSLNILLGASNSQDMIRIRLDLEQAILVNLGARAPRYEVIDDPKDVDLLEEGSFAIRDQDSFINQRLSRIENLLLAQTTQMKISQRSQIGPLSDAQLPLVSKRPTFPMCQTTEKDIRESTAAVSLRLRNYRTNCEPGCSCSCHKVHQSASPSFAKLVMGRLFVGYTSLPMMGVQCDHQGCRKSQTPSVSVEYWFPLGFFWSQIIRFRVAYETNVGPSFQLSTFRSVSDSSPCVSFALAGNIIGLKTLFSQGLASPRDVSYTRGYSLLRWALYGQQYEMCKFLLSVGVDPTYRPISASDASPSEKACDIILRGGLSPEVMDIIRLMTEGYDFIEDSNFSIIHKIVLKLATGDLETELYENLSDLDVLDAGGRTPLQWAAARGDEASVATLLSFGADTNHMDPKLNTPLTLAANQGHAVCVRLLLEAGAETDPVLPDGVKFGTPLNCAARNAPDPMLLKTLLDFGANIEASGVDGVTPLLHVARCSTAAHAMVLLEYGAKVNATAKSGQTPLIAAIENNNHGVLKLLLSRWFEYNECPRLKGPNLLETTARYGDEDTMFILTAAEHFRTRQDNTYVLQHCKKILEARDDVSSSLLAAFEDLVCVLSNPAELGFTIESTIESGLLFRRLQELGFDEGSTHSGDSTPFEDAVEKHVYLDAPDKHVSICCKV